MDKQKILELIDSEIATAKTNIEEFHEEQDYGAYKALLAIRNKIFKL